MSMLERSVLQRLRSLDIGSYLGRFEDAVYQRHFDVSSASDDMGY